MAREYRSYQDAVIEHLKDDFELQKAYLQQAIEEYNEDGNEQALLMALRHVIDAQGGIPALTEKTSYPKQTLYQAFSEKGNPRFSTLMSVFRALGMKLSVS
ncbi:MAG: putative addiction module antidote protein [Trueperaceae bacterium]|nr:putative addiction module antidote protein [Trueperaceae bacterium]